MRLDINTLETEFSPEEWKMIKDYLKWVKQELTYPTKPEIAVGGARYPIGRFTIRRGIIQAFKKKLEVIVDNSNETKTERYNSMIEALSNIQTILLKVNEKGKTVNSIKRK